MKLCIFSVYDAKAEAYVNPFYMRSKGEAIRAFTGEVNNKESMYNKHSEDFTLFQLGEFDARTGEIKCYDVKQPLGCAIEYRKQDGLKVVE